MRRSGRAWAVGFSRFALVAGFLSGCGGGPEPLPPSHGELRAQREQAATRPTGKVPEGTLAPIDAWRTRLSEELPAPWRLGSIDAQIIAPTGWVRIKGDRGLVVWAENGDQRQSFWVLPAGWKGQPFDPAVAAVELTRNDRFILFAQKQDAPGWTATEVVRSALGFGSEVASKD